MILVNSRNLQWLDTTKCVPVLVLPQSVIRSFDSKKFKDDKKKVKQTTTELGQETGRDIFNFNFRFEIKTFFTSRNILMLLGNFLSQLLR